MARKIDWGPTNQLLKQWQSFMMQDMLGQKRSERSMDYLRKQMSEYERLDVLQNEMRKELQGEKNELDKELALYKTLLDASQDASLDSLKKTAQAYAVSGQQDLAEKAMQRYYEGVEPLAKQNVKILNEEGLDAPGVVDILNAMPIDEGRLLLQSHATGLRAKRTAETAKGRLGLDVEKFGLEKKKQALTREKFEAEQGGEGAIGGTEVAPTQPSVQPETPLSQHSLESYGKYQGALRDIDKLEAARESGVQEAPPPTAPTGELTPEEAVNVLAGMIIEKAKARGVEMTLAEATAAARRQLGIK